MKPMSAGMLTGLAIGIFSSQLFSFHMVIGIGFGMGIGVIAGKTYEKIKHNIQ